jgi:hypothetical protein
MAHARFAGECCTHSCTLTAACFLLHAQDHIDYLSLQALLYKRATMSLGKQVMTILAHSKRLADAN